MKTKILLIVIVLSAVGLFAFVQSRKMSNAAKEHSEWIDKATSLAQTFDKATAGHFLKTKHLKQIGLGESPAFSRDTLYLKFHKQFEMEAYNEGVLLTSFGFSDTMNAICLLYGIASHTIQCNPVDYGTLSQYHFELDKIRALQYALDVMRQISQKDYQEMLRLETERIDKLKQFEPMDSLVANKCFLILQKSFGKYSSAFDMNLRQFRLELSSCFDICDAAYGDSDQAWKCKIKMYDDVYYSFSSIFLQSPQ